VEHDMDVVRRYVTRILAFRDGLMIADGAPDEVMHDAQVASAVLRGKSKANNAAAPAKAGAA